MEQLNCPTCGYNLTGLTRDVCPECGQPFDRLTLGRKPWPVSRREFLWRLLMAPSMWWIAILLAGIGIYLNMVFPAIAAFLSFGAFAASMAVVMCSIPLSLWNAWMLGRQLGPAQAYRREPDPALARTTLWTCLIAAGALAIQSIVMAITHLLMVLFIWLTLA